MRTASGSRHTSIALTEAVTVPFAGAMRRMASSLIVDDRRIVEEGHPTQWVGHSGLSIAPRMPALERQP